MDTAYKTTLELDKVLNRAVQLCACQETKEMMQALEPAPTIEDERYDLTQTNAINALLIKNGSPRFGSVREVRRIVAHARKGGILSMGELLEIAATLRNFSGLSQWYGLSEHEMLPTDDLFFALAPQPVLEKQISESIISPEEMADTASVTLHDLRRKIRQTEDSIRTKLDNIIRNSTTNKFLQDAVVSLRNGRYVVPVRAEYRGEVGGVIHDVSSTGATVFVEPTAVVEANARIMQLRAQEQEEITRILTSFSTQVGSLEPQFTYSYDAMLKIDLLLAKARLAVEQNAFMPAVSDTVHFKLNKARHPLIDKKKVVPVDIELGSEYDTLVITGPNTGGKTVSLKTAGLLNAMAQYGFLIPAHESSIVCHFDEYLVDIGDEQSIEQSLSTFSGHMTNLVEILNEVRSGDLVLVDEICAGTDPNEGAALAMAMLEHLHEQGVLTMITTHYSELKTFAYGHTGMENASVEFDPVSLRPTYRLLMGVPGSSNAFNISRRLGLSEEIVENAGKLLDQEHVHMEDVLHELEGERRQYESQNKEIQMLRLESERIKQELHKQKQELDRRKNEMLRKAREQADEIYRSSRRESEAILKELRSMKADFDAKKLEAAAEAARKQLNKQFSEDAPLPEGTPLSKETAKVGQTVFLPSLRQNGTIVAVNGGDVTVQVGILKTNVPAKNCLLVKGKTKVSEDLRPKKRKGYAHDMLVTRTASTRQELDVRGMTIEEAIPTVDKGIDDALLAGLPELRIIHGKGTGALRAGLTAYLSAHRAVKRLELASLHEGGAGATVIYL